MDAATGLATPWNPGAYFTWIGALATSGDSVYVGGYFYRIGGQERDALAAFDLIVYDHQVYLPLVRKD